MRLRRWQVDGFVDALKKNGLLLKTRAVLGPRNSDDEEIDLLNGTIRWVDGMTSTERIEIDSDPRHLQILLAEFGLQKANPVVTPGQKGKFGVHDPPYLDPSDHTRFRSLCMRLAYLAADRPDLQ